MGDHRYSGDNPGFRYLNLEFSMTTEYRISSTASANERFVLAQYMFVLLIPALLAIIIFGHVAEAAAPIKHMVAATAIFGILSIYLIVSGAMREFEALTKDASEEESALHVTQENKKQPWAGYQIYAIVATGLPLLLILMAIYG